MNIYVIGRIKQVLFVPPTSQIEIRDFIMPCTTAQIRGILEVFKVSVSVHIEDRNGR